METLNVTDERNVRTHHHHAEARALFGDFVLPLKSTIEPQAQVQLEAKGGYAAQDSLPFRTEGVISYRSARTQVAGNRDAKPAHLPEDQRGWNTVSTSVIEGLNILEVLTADRIVAQVFAEYPAEGYIPRISFLGSRFENLRIAGEPVNIKLDINLFGDKPADDRHYTHKDESFMARALERCQSLCAHPNLPKHTHETYSPYNGGAVVGETTLDGKTSPTETMECSLVTQIEAPSLPGKIYGHTLYIPHFGTVHLATVKLLHDGYKDGAFHKTTVELTMIDAKLGCIGHGSVSAGRSVTNGGTSP